MREGRSVAKKKKKKDDGQKRDDTETIICKRPDVAKRKREQKEKVTTVVKSAVLTRAGARWGSSAKAILMDELERWVISTSKVTHRMSLIWNRLLLKCLNNDIDIPELHDGLFTGMAMSGLKKNPKNSAKGFSGLIDSFVATEFKDFPKIERQRGDSQAITIAALRYKTNFKNSLFVPFFRRQKDFVYKWCEKHGIEEDRHIILFRINGWILKRRKKKGDPEDPVFSPVVNDFINKQREMLGQPQLLNETAVKRMHPNVILRYYFHIIKYYENIEEGKRFSVAPVSTIKAHYLTIDNTVLFELIKNVLQKATDSGCIKEIPEIIQNIKKQDDIGDNIWKEVFDWHGLRQRRTFDNRIDTDGVSACFHFTYSKKRCKKGKKRLQQKRKRNVRKRVISIDPGRSNLICGRDSVTGKYYRLTRRQYYRDSGMTRRFRISANRRTPLNPVYDEMSLHPYKTSSESNLRLYQETTIRHYHELWRIHTLKSTRRDDLRVYSLKQKCLDRFFNTFIIDGEKPYIAYGGASMNPTGKGELSVPVKYIFKKCCERFDTGLYNEDYTTKTHHKCQSYTAEVALSDSQDKIRGLRWCSTCRELVSRDKNACLNIEAVYSAESKGQPRPQYLSRTSYPRKIKLPIKKVRGGRPGDEQQKGSVVSHNIWRCKSPQD